MSMFSATELAELREMNSSALPDSGTVTRPAAGGIVSDGGATYTPSSPTPIYDGPLRIKAATVQEVTAVFGDELVTQVRHIGVLPHDAPTVKVGDTVTVTTSSDPHVHELGFRVRGVANVSYLVDRRVALEVIG